MLAGEKRSGRSLSAEHPSLMRQSSFNGSGDSGNGGDKAAESFRAPLALLFDGSRTVVVFDAALDTDGEDELRPPASSRR